MGAVRVADWVIFTGMIFVTDLGAATVFKPNLPQEISGKAGNISTALDGFRAADVAVEIEGDDEVISFAFRRGEDELMVAMWLAGAAVDDVREAAGDVRLPNIEPQGAWAPPRPR